MRIPKSFQLHGNTYKVSLVDDIAYKDGDKGHVIYRLGLIELQKRNSSVQIPQSQVEESFFHELTHAILDAMDFNMKNEEHFVRGFSRLLHQALTTVKF